MSQRELEALTAETELLAGSRATKHRVAAKGLGFRV